MLSLHKDHFRNARSKHLSDYRQELANPLGADLKRFYFSDWAAHFGNASTATRLKGSELFGIAKLDRAAP